MLTRLAGKSNVYFLQNWAKTGAFFGSTAALGFLYVTDWKAVLQYLPIYNTKFKVEE